MKTEDEARQCWCPFARQYGGRNRSADYIGDVVTVEGTQCIASDCMAWRWGADEDWEKKSLGGGHSVNSPRGYCGLAGRPT